MRRQLPALLLLSTASLAQVAVEGDVVLKTTGAPLAGVRVAAGCPELQWAATDVAGHFRFPVLRRPCRFARSRLTARACCRGTSGSLSIRKIRTSPRTSR